METTSIVHPSKALGLAMLAPVLTVDTETNGKDIRDGRGFCIGVSIAGRRPDGSIFSAYFPVAHTKDNISDDLQYLLADVITSHSCVVFHNAKFDLDSIKSWFRMFPEELRNHYIIRLLKLKYYCTMLMAHLVNENWASKGLDWLCKNVLGREGKRKPPEWEMMFSIYGWSEKFPANVMETYATGDAEQTLYLFEYLRPKFKTQGFDDEFSPL